MPVFVLTARDDDVVPPPQSTAIEQLCRHGQVTSRVLPGGHLALFLGRLSLDTGWRDAAHWLAGKLKPAGRKASSRLPRVA
jgi:poly(3-hydroxyalkanoate) synthetase